MNNQSPLIPQGSLLEQKNQGRARVKIAVFFVLAIHGIGLMALLMQGCQKEKTPPPDADLPTNTTPATVEATNPPTMDTNPPTLAATNPPATPTAPVEPVVAPAAATEYTVVQGDTLGGIAKKNHVSLKALTEANSGVEPTKLKIGQKLHIPAPAAAATLTPATAAVADNGGGEGFYTVKAGDVLYNIAKAHGTTVKALRLANDLKSDRIVVGQKLKIPAKSGGTTTPADTTATSAPPTAPGR